jgi:hypothetical protein
VRRFPAQQDLQLLDGSSEPHGFLLQVNQTLPGALLSDFKYFATDKSQLPAPIVQLSSLKNLGHNAVVSRLLIFDGIRNGVVLPVAGHRMRTIDRSIRQLRFDR